MSTTSTPPALAPRRFFELDSLRGVAALTVVFYHFSRICSEQVVHILLHTPLRLLVAGHQAVILFFLLSGFVLTLPYRNVTHAGYGPFLLKRVCRIYLPYLAALALAILGDHVFPAHRRFDNYWLNLTWAAPITTRLVVQHVLFLGNYDWGQFNTAFWSLVYEMRISLIFPFLALAVLRLRARTTLFIAPMLSLASLPLARLFSHVFKLSSFDAALNTTLTLHYAAFFLIGSLMAKHLSVITDWYARLTLAQAAPISLAALLLYTFGNSSSLVDRFAVPKDLYDWPIAAGAAMLIVLAMHSRPFHLFLTSRAIHHLGRVSYSLYLIHGTILFALVHTVYGRMPLPALLVLYLAITLAVTELFYRAIERPAMLLGRRLTTRPPQPLHREASASI